MSGESATSIHKGQVDLLDFIDWTGVECLNKSRTHFLPNAIKQGYTEDGGLHLESDADEQLLLYIPFTQVIKLYSIAINGLEDEGVFGARLFVGFLFQFLIQDPSVSSLNTAKSITM